MASKSICSRCLRLTNQSNGRLSLARTTQRVFTTTAAKQPSTERRIHSSSRRTLPDTQTQRTQANEVPPYSSPRGRSTDQHHDEQRVLLQPNNLFHSFTNSPSPQIRRRAAFMRQNAYCPHPDHQPTRASTSPHDTESRKTGASPPAHVRYECPDCGIPVACNEEHFAGDYESHLEICDLLRQINEDDHDLLSGRFFPEFEYPGPQIEEAQINMTNWDTLLYSREFKAINDERSMRQVTRLLTYPTTIASVLHELSPYSLNNRLTPEGLRSLSGESTLQEEVSSGVIWANPPQRYAIPSIHPSQAQVLISKACAQIPHPCVCSFSARAQNPRFPARSGSSSRTSSPAPPSTSSSSDPKAWRTATPSSLSHRASPETRSAP